MGEHGSSDILEAVDRVSLTFWFLVAIFAFFMIIYILCKHAKSPSSEMELPVYRWKHGEPITKITDVWTVQEIDPSAKIEIHS